MSAAARGERLQKLIARGTRLSRRAADQLIGEGRVTVNGAVAVPGQRARPGKDAIKVDGKLLQLPTEHVYLALHKPEGVVTTVSDPEGRPTVLDLVPPGHRKAVFPVGRLDFDSEGLLLLTDDGEWAQRVQHPSSGCWKTYQVKVKGTPSADAIDRLRAGIRLEGRRLQPSRIRAMDGAGGHRAARKNTWWQVSIQEGRRRQVREMFHRVGHPVQRLRRVAVGPIRLGRLAKGAVRELTAKEIEAVRRLGTGTGETAARGRARRKPGSAEGA